MTRTNCQLNPSNLILIVYFVLLLPFSLNSQTIPTDYWVYGSIRKLQTTGNFSGLLQGSLPYSRMSIASELLRIKPEIGKDSNLHPELEMLRIEFAREIEKLGQSKPQNNLEYLLGQSRQRSRYSTVHGHQLGLTAGLSYTIGSVLNLQYAMIIDQAFIHDVTYMGYEWRGFAGYQDQLALSYNAEHLKILFGRDYQSWGYGHTGGLFISDNSRPFDMIKISIFSKYFTFESFTAQLDQMYGAQRYLTATRMAINLSHNTTLGLGQSALYGGVDRSIDFTLSNPLSFYSFTQDNDNKYMNGMLYADLYLKFVPTFNVYGELLIDDFQIDHSQKADLEPNEIAFLLGFEGVNAFDRVDWWAEIIQIRNRTYNVPNRRPWEKFLHRGLSIAHPVGNDFRLFSIMIESWILSDLKVYSNFTLIHQGEGTITGVFDEPWMSEDITLETGYSEKVPFGIVEKSNIINLGVYWHPYRWIEIDASIGYISTTNHEHLLHLKHSGKTATLQITTDINWINYIN
jgi:hypothetical protein